MSEVSVVRAGAAGDEGVRLAAEPVPGRVCRGRRLLRDGSEQREAADALGAPLGADLGAGDAPKLFGVALEEGLVELAPEAVDEEVLQAAFRADGAEAGAEIAGGDGEGAARAKLPQRCRREVERIGEKAAEVVDAALPRAEQEDVVGVPGAAGARGARGRGVPRGLQWQDVLPPLHDALTFGEEAVAADVDAVALVLDGAGEAANHAGGFEDDGQDVGAAKEFECGGEAGRACADDDGDAPGLRHACRAFHRVLRRLVQGCGVQRISCSGGWSGTACGGRHVPG